MTTIIIAAIICAACTIYLVVPVAQDKTRATFALMVLLPLASLILYLILGAPGLPSKAALFEKDKMRIHARALVKEEMDLMEKLSNDPDNPQLMLALGSVRVANDRFDDALAILERAHKLAPKNKDIRLQLGAAHFVLGLYAAEEGRKTEAGESFQKALKIAPGDAPYRKDLKKIIAASGTAR